MAVAFQPSERRPAAREAPARRGRWGLRLVAAMGGAAFALAFPAPGLWWWAYIGLVPVLELVSTSPDRREALWRCWSAGCGYFLALYHWLMPSLSVFALPLVLVTGLVWLPWGLVAWWLLRAPRSAGRAAAAIVAVMPGLGTRVRLGAGAGAALLVGGAVAYGLSRPEPDITATLRIGGVQPGVVDDRRERLAAHEDLSRELAATETDVVVWGQSSLGFDLEAEAWARERVLALARELDRPLLVNVDARGPGGRISKTMVVVRPDGLGETYTKQRLVPFGEYIPLRPLFGWVERFTEAAEEDRAPGTDLISFPLGDVRVGPLISYESTFPDMRRTHARAGVDVTLVQAAATTFQGTWALPQQASFEAVRAVESGRPAVLVAVSGTSAAFDSRGRRLAWVDQHETGAWTAEVPLSREDTLFVLWGDWVPATCLVVMLATVMVAAVPRRAQVRRFGPAGSGSPGPGPGP